MEIQNSDTVVSNGRLYRAFKKPDGTVYRSMTAPSHTEGMRTLDGINWVMSQEQAVYNCGCRNLHFKDIHLKKKRDIALSIHFDHDVYSRSVYPGSEMPVQENIVFENVTVQDDTACLIRSITPVDVVKICNSVIGTKENGNSTIRLETLPGQEGTYEKTRILLQGNTCYGDPEQIVECEEGREYELTGDIQKKRESDYWKSIELSLMEKAAVSYYPSYVEVDAVHELRPEFRLKAITAYVYETFLEKIDQDFAKREGLLFVGGFAHPPNADAVLWFAKEVFPLIRNHCPVNFYIVGSKVTEEVQALDDPEAGIIVKGFVTEEELAKLYASCRLVVVPLRYGAGVKGKVVEAVYYGSAIVTSSIGAEGIPEAERVMRIGDTPEEFARLVEELYENPEECRRLSMETQRYIREHFSVEAAWSVIAEDFSLQPGPQEDLAS